MHAKHKLTDICYYDMIGFTIWAGLLKTDELSFKKFDINLYVNYEAANAHPPHPFKLAIQNIFWHMVRETYMKKNSSSKSINEELKLKNILEANFFFHTKIWRKK